LLNLNKFIKPDFAIFRVAELYKEPIRREFATSFFNGYGTELNIFAPGQPDWIEDQYRYLGRTTRILREHSDHFTHGVYTPLITVTADSIWASEWAKQETTIYTIFSLLPQGFKGLLFKVRPRAGTHFVDLWHHKLLQPVERDGATWIESETDAFHISFLGTNNEGAVDAIAQFPVYLTAHRNGDRLLVSSSMGDTVKVWAGVPDYEKKPLLLNQGDHDLRISEHFGRFEGKLVLQLFRKGALIDETIIDIPPGSPRRISLATPLSMSDNIPEGMVRIPAGRFVFKESHGDAFIPYPAQDVDSSFAMPSYLMDRFPVTNLQFRKFLETTGYRPKDTVNFLKHWVDGQIPRGQEQFPVVYVSYEDAQAFAHWAGKRLPTELEWQYAAQTPVLREWPWDQRRPVTRKEQVVTETLTVTALEGIDPRRCNLGDGQPYPVGRYSEGANPYGLQDLVGCVWQLTNDLYMNGSYTYIIMKGGSFFKPSSSWWYVQGGPRELHYRQYLLRVSQGFERNATVGFRCVR
jgi:formylglycine-generating enzyme required for sulfatase activity